MSVETKDGFNDIDFEELTILNGETPADISARCHQLCADYLGGVWDAIGLDQLRVTQISGGFNNQLFRCTLADGVRTVEDEPEDVVIRFYGDPDKDHRNDIIISLTMSEKNLGPLIYGFFESGEILMHYEHRHFRVSEQNDVDLVQRLAQKLARFHSLKIAINKNNKNWTIKTIDSNIDKAYVTFPIDELAEQYCPSLLTINIRDEIEWLKRAVEALESPIVFCHNDFRGNNIMVAEMDINQNYAPRDRITLCDFETAGYGYRGTDLGTIFSEWGRALNGYKTLHNFPDDSIIEPFVREYKRESTLIYGKNYAEDCRNSVDQLLAEVKVFALVSNMFMLSVCLSLDASKSVKEFTKKFLMMGADIHVKNYLHLKNLFLKQKIV